MKELYRLTMHKEGDTRVEFYNSHKQAAAAAADVRYLDAMTIEKVDPTNDREYRIAYAMGDGKWDVVDRFAAKDDDAANAYALVTFDGDEWFVLDDTGRNINGGRDQA